MKKILLGLGFTLATLALVLVMQLSPGRVEAQGNGQCVEVPAPDPIQFEEWVSKRIKPPISGKKPLQENGRFLLM